MSDEFKIFTNINTALVDPKNFTEDNFITIKGPYFNSTKFFCTFLQLRILLNMPRNVLCICVGKSTYARTGIICNVTVLENEFGGNMCSRLNFKIILQIQ